MSAGPRRAGAGRRGDRPLAGAGRGLPGGGRLLLHAGGEPGPLRAAGLDATPEGLSEIANQFSISALDGAACQLGVTRETLARALASPEARERFAERYGIDEAKLARAVRAGLLRAVDDAEEAGALSPFIAGPLRGTIEEIPLDQAIELINDADSLLGNVQSFLGPAQDLLEEFLP